MHVENYNNLPNTNIFDRYMPMLYNFMHSFYISKAVVQNLSNITHIKLDLIGNILTCLSFCGIAECLALLGSIFSLKYSQDCLAMYYIIFNYYLYGWVFHLLTIKHDGIELIIGAILLVPLSFLALIITKILLPF